MQQESIGQGKAEETIEKTPVQKVQPLPVAARSQQFSEIRSRVRQAMRPMVREAVVTPQKERKVVSKDKLEEVLIKRIAVNPKDIEAYERLGDYYLESTSYQDSLECFKQVLKLSPTHQKARLSIRRLERLLRK